MTLALALYRQGMRAFHGLAPRVLRQRVAKGKEDAGRWRERLGDSPAKRGNGPLVWFHGVSVGESLSAIPVIEAIRRDRPDLYILITSATTTSAEILARRLPAGVVHQFAPIDTPQAIQAFLDHWQPDLAVFIESDIWPVLLGELAARKVPHVLLSARITEKTAKGWRRFRTSMRTLLSGYSLISAQDEASEARLKTMGSEVAARIGRRANLKTLGAPLPVDLNQAVALKALSGRRFVWLAASTHPGEERLIVQALKDQLDADNLLILAPRHPMRAAEIRAELEGLRVAQRSQGETIDAETQVYLADTLGELGTLFQISNLVIMGGSFMSGIGGHNPLEPARLGKCVLTGPDIANWQAIYDGLFAVRAAFRADTATLADLLTHLRDDPATIRAADARALAFSQQQDGALAIVMQALTPLLPEAR